MSGKERYTGKVRYNGYEIPNGERILFVDLNDPKSESELIDALDGVARRHGGDPELFDMDLIDRNHRSVGQYALAELDD